MGHNYKLVFYKDDSLIAKIIKFVTKSKYCHVSILIDNMFIYETDVFKKSHICIFEYDHSKHEVYEFNGEVSDYNARKFMATNLGNSYDYMEILKILLKNNKLKDKQDEYICSTLVLEFIKKCTNIKIDGELKLATPQDLIDLEVIRNEGFTRN